ncbi:pyruvate dehydrogenase E1 component subunit beta (ODPB) [Vairimorpha necatrix]|uniref:Pyruvate dehydrogenase E1 component subunit beta n=1 Tax=Vairimorpha necatrix TaxID=6039 RepID=A0AAX4JFD5_9MICR
MFEIRELINQAFDEEMSTNPDIFIIGEEVGLSGGPHGLTKNLLNKFGERRVRDTPISEMGFTGLAVGASYLGLRPVVDFMTWNFALQSIDHIINSCAKTSYMSGRQVSCPIVFRGPNGFNSGYAAQHTQDFAQYYGAIPGVKVVCPYTGRDHKGLLKSAIRDNNPVIILENEMLYRDKYDTVPFDYLQDLDKSVIEKVGKDVSVIGISISLKEVFKSDKILKERDIDIEIINLVSIRPIDYESIIKSAEKTKRVVIVDFSYPCFSVASEIAVNIYERMSEVKIVRVLAEDIPTPYAENLECLSYPTYSDVVDAVTKIMQ